jgi:hypothetical protein
LHLSEPDSRGIWVSLSSTALVIIPRNFNGLEHALVVKMGPKPGDGDVPAAEQELRVGCISHGARPMGSPRVKLERCARSPEIARTVR